jgi:hypothetical protein
MSLAVHSIHIAVKASGSPVNIFTDSKADSLVVNGAPSAPPVRSTRPWSQAQLPSRALLATSAAVLADAVATGSAIVAMALLATSAAVLADAVGVGSALVAMPAGAVANTTGGELTATAVGGGEVVGSAAAGVMAMSAGAGHSTDR